MSTHAPTPPSQPSDQAVSLTSPDPAGAIRRWWPIAAALILAALQLIVLSWRFDPHAFGLSQVMSPSALAPLKALPPALTGFVVTMFVLRRAALFSLLDQRNASSSRPRRARHRPGVWLGVSLIMFAIAVGPIAWELGPDTAAPAHHVIGRFGVWVVFGLAAMAALAGIVAPVSGWLGLLFAAPGRLAIAIAAGAGLAALVLVFQSAWAISATGAMWVSHGLLSLVYDGVHIDPASKVLGVNDFWVTIAPNCSGLEGVALILAFTSGYLWLMRDDLRFPRALILIPLGMTVMWMLNAVRIALLIALGDHVSPELAVGGFHSQAGWMMFLVASFAIMAAAHTSGLFTRAPSPDALPKGHGDDARPAATDIGDVPDTPADQNADNATLATLLLAPFLAMMLASVAASAFTQDGFWLYGLKVVAMAGVLIAFHRGYAALLERVGMWSVVVGVAVGAAWIATEPRGVEHGADLAAWLGSLPPSAMLGWLIMRGLGTIILVPIAEELAFRGYVYRKLVSLRFEHVDLRALSWVALIVSSALFGMFHGRWLAAMLAGAAFALVMIRTGRLNEAVVAHMVANGMIFAWAVGFDDWALL